MTDQESRVSTRTDWLLIGVLLALVLPLRLWLLCNTEVAARDSIGYIRYALQFERMPWQEVLEKNHQHPGYPLCVWLMSLPVRAIDGETTPENMALSTQLVNLLAALFLMAPTYFLGRQFFDRTVSFGATLLYQYLPISAHHLSDGISEPIYLVLLVSALLQMAMAMRDRRIAPCLACGVFTGLAYLVRPEGLLVLPAFGFALLVMQWSASWRSTRGRFFACGAAMLLTTLLIASIYVSTTGRITNKLAALETIKNVLELLRKPFTSPPDVNVGGAGAGRLFAVTFVPSEHKAIRFWQCVSAYGKEIIQGLHYVSIVTAILGFWWSFRSLRAYPAFWALVIYALLHSLILMALGMTASYVSDRHVMILVLCGCFFVILGLRELPRFVLIWFKVDTTTTEKALTPGSSPGGRGENWYRSAPVWFAVLFVALIGFCLPKATQRLHGNRTGNHQAGVWLREHVRIGDVVEDDHSWSHFFAGLIFREGRERALPKDHQATCYVVTTRSRDPWIDSQRLSARVPEDAQVVYVWPVESDPAQARVIVHAQPRDYQTHPWRIAGP